MAWSILLNMCTSQGSTYIPAGETHASAYAKKTHVTYSARLRDRPARISRAHSHSGDKGLLPMLPTPDTSAISPLSFELAKLIFQHVFCYFSIPEDVVTVQDLQFNSCLFGSFIENQGVTVRVTSVYHPQANGQVESTTNLTNILQEPRWLGSLPTMIRICPKLKGIACICGAFCGTPADHKEMMPTEGRAFFFFSTATFMAATVSTASVTIAILTPKQVQYSMAMLFFHRLSSAYFIWKTWICSED